MAAALLADHCRPSGAFLVALGTPFLFRAYRRSKLDRFLGDLSYPVYVMHPLVLDWLTTPVIRSASSALPFAALVGISLALVALVSVLLLIAFDWPMERFRAIFADRAATKQFTNLLASAARGGYTYLALGQDRLRKSPLDAHGFFCPHPMPPSFLFLVNRKRHFERRLPGGRHDFLFEFVRQRCGRGPIFRREPFWSWRHDSGNR
jgi:hypothetical protein